MTTPLTIGIISFAHTHAIAYATALAGRDDVSVVVHDPLPHPDGELRGRALADQLGVRSVDTLEELFAAGLDGVVVASENTRHREFVERAAREGVHVLCEKPLATTAEDGAAIAAAVEAAGVQLMVAFPVRFASSVAEAKALLDGGALGELVAVRGTNNGKLPSDRAWFTDPALSGGGALVDHVVHVADVVEHLTGAKPVDVTAITNRILHADRASAETAGLVTVRYETGMIVTVDCSWSRPEQAPTWGGLTFTLVGTKGTVDVDVFGPRARGIDGRTGAPIELPYGADFDAALLDAFLETVRGAGRPDPGLTTGLRTLAIVLAAQRSAAEGATVPVESR